MIDTLFDLFIVVFRFIGHRLMLFPHDIKQQIINIGEWKSVEIIGGGH